MVGAGPAGAVAALLLARSGTRTTLVDMQAFPRDKACGDLIGTDAVASLQALGLADTLAGSFALDGARVYGPSLGSAGHVSGAGRGAASACVLERAIFDARLVRHAIDAGAEFVAARALGVTRDARGAVRGVRTASGEIEARVVIGADGYGSAIERSLRPPVTASKARADVAIVARAYATGVHDIGQAMHFYVNRKADGYGWVFPLGGGRANVGLGYIESEGRHDVRAGFERFVGLDSPARAMLSGARVAAVKTWPIPLGWQRRVIAAPGVFLAGDAAALASPLSGSGIANAVRSGERAAREARHFLDGKVDASQRYARSIRTQCGLRLQIEGYAHRVAGRSAVIGPWLAIARLLRAEMIVSRALLALG